MRWLAGVMMLLLSASAVAGALDEFEESVANPPKSAPPLPDRPASSPSAQRPHQGEHDHHHNHQSSGCEFDLGCMAFEILFRVGVEVIVHAGSMSAERLESGPAMTETGQTMNGLRPREKGETLIPYLRVDGGFQQIGENVEAVNARLEMGYAVFGMQVSYSNYREKPTGDDFNIKSWHLLYRMSGSDLEVDLGIGGVILNGNSDYNGLSTTLPIHYRFNKNVTLEFRPVWSDINGASLSDYDLSLLYGINHLGLALGYHSLQSDTETLEGPYLGISLLW